MRMTRSILLLLAVASAGCSLPKFEVPRIPGLTPYRIEIQQGNYLSQEAVSRLRPGMTKDQVRNILGTPLLTDIFHAERWDYVYFLEHPNGNRDQRKLAVFFADGKLARLDGDVVVKQEPAP